MNLKKWMAVACVLTAGGAAALVFTSELAAVRAERQLERQQAQALSTARTTSARPGAVASVTIDGTVIGSAPMAGTLTLRVGNAVSTRAISVSPDYSFVVSSAQSNDMVSMEIATPSYRFASLLGSFGKLKRQAGTDGRLSAAESDRVRVTPFSTAMYFFVQRELGRLPASDAEHERVVRSLMSDDLFAAAGILDDLAQGRTVLPAGLPDGYALLRDRTAYRAYIAQNGSGSFNPMSAPSVPILPGQLSPNMLLTGAIPPRGIAMFNPGVRILSQDGSSWNSYADSRRNPRFTPSFPASGDFVLAAQGTVTSDALTGTPVDPSQTSVFAVERSQIVRETYRQLFAGDRYSLWAVRTEVVISYPEYPAQAPKSASRVALYAVSSLDGVLPFRPTDVAGDRGLPFACKRSLATGVAQQLETCESAVHHFSGNNLGSTERVGLKIDAIGQPVVANGSELFQWSINRRMRLDLTYLNVTANYWRLEHANDAVDTLAFLARSQDGADTLSVVGLTGMINANLPGDFADLAPSGIWRYWSFDSARTPYGYTQDLVPVTTVFDRKPDGTTTRNDTYYYDPPDGPYDFRVRFGWQLFDGSLYETRYRANVSTGVPYTSGFSSCAQAYQRGATQCAPYQIRYFRPLARVGNRLYGLQESYLLGSSSYAQPYNFIRSTSVNYIEKQ
jgi:hypothetical protein